MTKNTKIKLHDTSSHLDTLSEEERRALRGSRFAPIPTHVPNDGKIRARVPHPGGPVATNKAAALAKFLQRKLETSGTASLDPALVEAAVKNAKEALRGTSSSSLNIRHVETFSDDEKANEDEDSSKANTMILKKMKKKKKKKKKKRKKATTVSADED